MAKSVRQILSEARKKQQDEAVMPCSGLYYAGDIKSKRSRSRIKIITKEEPVETIKLTAEEYLLRKKDAENKKLAVEREKYYADINRKLSTVNENYIYLNSDCNKDIVAEVEKYLTELGFWVQWRTYSDHYYSRYILEWRAEYPGFFSSIFWSKPKDYKSIWTRVLNLGGTK